jgi:hypothetical protein
MDNYIRPYANTWANSSATTYGRSYYQVQQYWDDNTIYHDVEVVDGYGRTIQQYREPVQFGGGGGATPAKVLEAPKKKEKPSEVMKWLEAEVDKVCALTRS